MPTRLSSLSCSFVIACRVGFTQQLDFRFHFYRVSPHLCEILIAILSVHPSVTLQCSKKQQTHRKADGGETSTVGGETSSESAKRPGGETYRGETSRGRNVKGAKRPVTQLSSLLVTGESIVSVSGAPIQTFGIIVTLIQFKSNAYLCQKQ